MKTNTDIYWNERANSVKDDIEVNIMDIFQRNLEYEQITKYLTQNDDVLEVGCGNGFSTKIFRENVHFIDAFDYSENMIKRAKGAVGETNNCFFVDNLLNPQHIEKKYDVVICVRVLINLKNLNEQFEAIKNMSSFLKPNGKLILLEGFSDGFNKLNELRKSVELAPIEPAKINFYSSFSELLPVINKLFKIEQEFYLGSYDFFTRILYPLIIKPESAKHNTVFSERCQLLSKYFNPEVFNDFSRIKGLVMRKI